MRIGVALALFLSLGCKDTAKKAAPSASPTAAPSGAGSGTGVADDSHREDRPSLPATADTAGSAGSGSAAGSATLDAGMTAEQEAAEKEFRRKMREENAKGPVRDFPNKDGNYKTTTKPPTTEECLKDPLRAGCGPAKK